MKYISTNGTTAPVNLLQATGNCIAPDGGLYLPSDIPSIPTAFFNNISEMTLKDIAFVVCSAFLDEEVPSHELKNIVDFAFAFDSPIVRIDEHTFILELFHGPTLTFKDYGARFLAQLLKLSDKKSATRRNILIATSGNTGAAAANGLYKCSDTIVTVLYPKGKLSRVQTSQFASLGENIHPLEVAGTVEDCKKLVSAAMTDESLSQFHITGANSINIGRLIPQICFGLHAYARLIEMGVENAAEAAFSIPTGNLSNVVACAIAKKMGLPCGKIIAATNTNNQLERIMNGEVSKPEAPVRTMAPSIDMTFPTGWPRLKALYGYSYEELQKDILVASPVDDNMIKDTVNNLRETSGYTLDPHTAVAYAAAAMHAPSDKPKVIFATGHPAKQLNIMTAITGAAIELPVQLTRFMSGRTHPMMIPPTLPALKKFLTAINN